MFPRANFVVISKDTLMQTPNPYEAPSEQDAASRAQLPSQDAWFGWFEIAIICGLMFVLLAVIGHRCQFQDFGAYRSSPLIVFEVLGVLATLATIPVMGIRVIYCLTRRRFRSAIIAVLLGFAAIGTFVGSLLIDSPTLMYAT